MVAPNDGRVTFRRISETGRQQKPAHTAGLFFLSFPHVFAGIQYLSLHNQKKKQRRWILDY